MPVPSGKLGESPPSQLPRIVRESPGIHDVTLVNRPCQADSCGNLYVSLDSCFLVFLCPVSHLLPSQSIPSLPHSDPLPLLLPPRLPTQGKG